MKKYSDPDEWAAAVVKELVEYTDEVTRKVKAGIDVVSKEVKSAIESKAPVKTGVYRRSFRIKKSAEEDKYNKQNVWYVAAPYYRLTHLLENGTKRAKPHPHIEYGQEIAEQRMMEIVKEAIES